MAEKRQVLLEQLMEHMSQVHRHMATNRDRFLAQFELNRPQMELFFFVKHGPSTIGALAKQFSVSSSAVSQMVDQLVEKDLLMRVTDEKDRRVTHIHLTKRGTQAFEKIRTHFMEHLDERFTSITTEELETLLQIIQKVTHQLDKEN